MSFTVDKVSETTHEQTAPQHHLKAAEHLELASKAHKEAAKLHVAGDHKAVESQMQIAREHTGKANVQANEAAKKNAAQTAAHK